jgi:hypothetical protein
VKIYLNSDPFETLSKGGSEANKRRYETVATNKTGMVGDSEIQVHCPRLAPLGGRTTRYLSICGSKSQGIQVPPSARVEPWPSGGPQSDVGGRHTV